MTAKIGLSLSFTLSLSTSTPASHSTDRHQSRVSGISRAVVEMEGGPPQQERSLKDLESAVLAEWQLTFSCFLLHFFFFRFFCFVFQM